MADYKEYMDKLDRKAYHEGEWQWQEGDFTVTRTTHWSPPGCHMGCGVLLYTKDNKLEKVEGDPLNAVANGKLCMRCLDMPEAVNHPDRLKYPMRRAGERGEGKWERISWDEAYDEITEKVLKIKEEHGSQSIVVVHGTGRNIGWQVPYFASACMETPNVSTFGFTGFACYLPRMIGTSAKYGDMIIVDASQAHYNRYANEDWQAPGVILVWGNEPIKSNADGFLGHWLVQCVQMGSKIISVDPRLTWWGARAAYWLPVRPGTDAIVAMALLNVIISEDLYDHDFVDCWTYGFDLLAERVADKTPEWASPLCDVDPEALRGAARLIATSSSCACQWGLAFEQQIAALGVTEAVADIMAITGNIDNPGGNALYRCAYLIEKRYGLGDEYIDPEVYAKKLIPDKSGINESNIVSCADSDAILSAVETGEPYSIEMFWIQSSNALACASMDPARTRAALMKVPFIVVADPFMTPTAQALADIVLPVAMSCERNSCRTWWTPVRTMVKVTDYYEAKSDEQICLELGKRIKPEHWPWKDDKEWCTWYLTDQLTPGGTEYDRTWEETVQNPSENSCNGTAYWDWDATYRKYEKGMLRPDGQPGFNTPTGRIELWSFGYDHWGVDPLPYHIEPPESPLSTPETYKDYPIILSGGGRSFEFFHSEHRQLPTMREFHPWPLIMVNPEDCERYGVRDGEWIWVENSRGARFKQKVKETIEVRPGRVHAEHGWWFPEQEGAEPNFYGTYESNLNNMTEAFRTGQGGIGSAIKSMLCKIYPCQEGDVLPHEVIAEKGDFAEYEPGKPYEPVEEPVVTVMN
ncbi:molybdopterin-dependent oxidoreductase [Raoultibacter massiliensis]|uniref:Molybdopterin-dependent oxidoreductase n=1 Tax=Raoultibacter massiliensis TaxID=1852371 RepID=A0ABV1JF62_9ACTN|nr:molybdopterin-dependent oxidoreductase [Raoultibacter massiliensis]